MNRLLTVYAHTRRTLPVAHRDEGVAELAQRLFFAWTAAAGVVLFTFWWLQIQGAWRLQRQAQPGSPWRQSFISQYARSPEVAAQLLAERSHGPHGTAWWLAATAIKLGLLGTVVGLIGALWLGLQLPLLDRLAERLAADILADVTLEPANASAAAEERA